MVANILPEDPPLPDAGVGLKGQNQHFQNMVVLHIKLKGTANAAPW